MWERIRQWKNEEEMFLYCSMCCSGFITNQRSSVWGGENESWWLQDLMGDQHHETSGGRSWWCQCKQVSACRTVQNEMKCQHVGELLTSTLSCNSKQQLFPHLMFWYLSYQSNFLYFLNKCFSFELFIHQSKKIIYIYIYIFNFLFIKVKKYIYIYISISIYNFFIFLF